MNVLCKRSENERRDSVRNLFHSCGISRKLKGHELSDTGVNCFSSIALPQVLIAVCQTFCFAVESIDFDQLRQVEVKVTTSCKTAVEVDVEDIEIGLTDMTSAEILISAQQQQSNETGDVKPNTDTSGDRLESEYATTRL